MSLEKILAKLVELCGDRKPRKDTRVRTWRLGPVELFWMRIRLGLVVLSFGDVLQIELHRWYVSDGFRFGGKWWGALTGEHHKGIRYGYWRLVVGKVSVVVSLTLPAKKERGELTC